MYSLVIVDDEIWTLRDMEVLLRDVEGFTVIGAYTNPVEAEKAILQSPPDVVLTDLRMEEMTGQMLMKAIHESCPKTRIIICSAYRDFDAARDALKYDVIDYLLKPIVKEDFLRAFQTAQKLLDQERKEENAFSYQRAIASELPWTEEILNLIKKKRHAPAASSREMTLWRCFSMTMPKPWNLGSKQNRRDSASAANLLSAPKAGSSAKKLLRLSAPDSPIPCTSRWTQCNPISRCTAMKS